MVKAHGALMELFSTCVSIDKASTVSSDTHHESLSEPLQVLPPDSLMY